jgi:hypothetical protein
VSSLKPDEQLKAINSILADEFMLPPLLKYNIFVEGHTDIKYLQHAATMAITLGEDLLAVPSTSIGVLADQMQICSPRSISDPLHRGGVKELNRLGRELAAWLSRLDAEIFVMFVFDHDQAGITAMSQLRKDGIRIAESLTLDAEKHPGACGDKDVVIEDLLSTSIQRSFFDSQSDCSVWVQYVNGSIRRFSWDHPTKDALCNYVTASACWKDVLEIGRILARIREIWGLPVSDKIFTATAASNP